MPALFMILLFSVGAEAGELLSAGHGENEAGVAKLIDQAGNGDSRAQVELAVRYRDGKGVEKDVREALRWAHLAADRGDPVAMDFVGHAFLSGNGIPRNPEIAFGYFQAAAGKSATAAWNLGQCYYGAQGVEQDVPRALEIWKHAAVLGSGRAASTAAMVYLAGDGFVPDGKEALRLAKRAVELNDPSGFVVLGEIQFRSGEFGSARSSWTKASQLRPVGLTGQPIQSSADMAAQQGADLLKLLEYRRKKSEPGTFVLLDLPHVHQGYNNCGATASTTFARFQGSKIGAWEFKRLCPSPIGTGTDWDHLMKAAEKIGLHWKLLTFPPDESGFQKATTFVRSELDAGRPVLIDFKFIGPQYPNGEAGHTLCLAGYIASENLYILCNPAIASPGLQLITSDDLKNYWRSDHYSALSKGVLSRPVIVMDHP